MHIYCTRLPTMAGLDTWQIINAPMSKTRAEATVNDIKRVQCKLEKTELNGL